MCAFKRATINRQIYKKSLIDRNLGQKNEKKVTIGGHFFSTISFTAFLLFLHHLLHAFPSLAIGDVDDVYA